MNNIGVLFLLSSYAFPISNTGDITYFSPIFSAMYFLRAFTVLSGLKILKIINLKKSVKLSKGCGNVSSNGFVEAYKICFHSDIFSVNDLSKSLNISISWDNSQILFHCTVVIQWSLSWAAGLAISNSFPEPPVTKNLTCLLNSAFSSSLIGILFNLVFIKNEKTNLSFSNNDIQILSYKIELKFNFNFSSLSNSSFSLCSFDLFSPFLSSIFGVESMANPNISL